MAIVIPANWVSTQAYAVGAKVNHNGVGYECTTAVTANTDGNSIPVGNSSWKVFAVFRITEYYSLQESIELAIKTNDSVVNSSIPLYIQNAERLVGKLLRSPAQLITRTFTVDADSKFAIPADILEVEHLRLKTDTPANDLKGRGSISIQRMDRTAWRELNQYYSNTSYGYDSGDYEFPGFVSDEQYIYIAPDYSSGTEFEMTYYQEVPELGSTVGLINSAGAAINSAGQTSAQWVAAGNAASSFVQATQVVTSNLWSATLPHLIRAAACKEAEEYLDNSEKATAWGNQFKELMVAAEIEFKRYETAGSQHITQSSAYQY